MDSCRFGFTADNHIKAICGDGGTVVRTAAVLLAVARSRMVMIAANYGLSAHRSGVNHV